MKRNEPLWKRKAARFWCRSLKELAWNRLKYPEDHAYFEKLNKQLFNLVKWDNK